MGPIYVVTSVLFFLISLVFSMFGKGGGELFMVVLVLLAKLPYYTAAGITLFVLVLQGISMLIVYHRHYRIVDWLLATIVGVAAIVAAFIGGFIAGSLPATLLKLVFSALLIVSAYLILRGFSVKPGKLPGPRLRRRVAGYSYEFNPLFSTLLVSVIAFLAAMAGISGGSLIVPILVILGGVPLRVAIGTNPFLVLVSGGSGFIAHLLRGGFNPVLGMVLGIAAVTGSQIGSRLHSKLSDRVLRILFSAVMIFAAIIMIAKTII